MFLSRNRKSRSRKTRRLTAETLERRELFSVSPPWFGGELPMVGDNGVHQAPIVADAGAEVGGESSSNAAWPVTWIGFDGLGGDDNRELTDKDNGAELNAKTGDVITIRLRGNPSTGYAWKVVEATGEAVELDGQVEYQADTPGLPGGGGVYVFRFKAVKPGATTLKLAYARPWDDESAAADRFTVSVNVTADCSPDDNRPPESQAATHPRIPEVAWLGRAHFMADAIDQALSTAQRWWDAATNTTEALVRSQAGGSSMASVSENGSIRGDWGSANGSAQLDMLGYSSGTNVDADWSDGTVGCGGQASAYLLQTTIQGQFETVTVNAGSVAIKGYGQGSTSTIIGVDANVQAALGVGGLAVNSCVFVGGTVAADGTVGADIGGIKAELGGEAVVCVGAGLDATVAATVKGFQAEASAFAGDQFCVSGTATVGGVGVEGTGEAWAGIGCSAKADFAIEDGKINVHLAVGAALGVGGEVGIGLTIDAKEVGNNVLKAGERIGESAVKAGEKIGESAVKAGNQISKAVTTAHHEVQKAAKNVVKCLSRWF